MYIEYSLFLLLWLPAHWRIWKMTASSFSLENVSTTSLGEKTEELQRRVSMNLSVWLLESIETELSVVILLLKNSNFGSLPSNLRRKTNVAYVESTRTVKEILIGLALLRRNEEETCVTFAYLQSISGELSSFIKLQSQFYLYSKSNQNGFSIGVLVRSLHSMNDRNPLCQRIFFLMR